MANEFKIKNSLIINSSGSVNALDIQGSQGQLFSVTDSLSGSLFSVSDISGLPIIEVLSDDTVKMGTFANEALIVTGSRTGMGLSNPAAKLHVSGAANSALLEVDSVSSQNILFISGSGNVGIGTNNPAFKLDVSGTAQIQDSLRIVRSDNNSFVTRIYQSSVAGLNFEGTSFDFQRAGTTFARLAQNSTVTYWVHRMNINVPNVITDIGAALGVRGSGTTSATTGFRVESSAGTAGLTITDDGVSAIRSIASKTTTVDGATFNADIAAFNIIGGRGNNSDGILNVSSTVGSFAPNLTGTKNMLVVGGNFTLGSSATGNVNFLSISPTINYPTGSTGRQISILIDPVLTRVTDYRSIQWTNNTGWGLFGIGTAPNFLSGSLSLASGLTVTGSVIVSGSSTFTNIGPAIFSGSVGVAGSITATQFIGDGSQLTGVATPTPIRRHDYSGSYSYCGVAPSGSSEASSVWSIDRIQVLNDGNVTITSASLVTWTGRYTHIYV